MFWWRKKWLDELSDSDESPFLECRHLLFEDEAGLSYLSLLRWAYRREFS